MSSEYDDDEPKPTKGGKFNEFDCPECNANNPMGDGFGVGDDIRCMYCGQEFEVKDKGDGRIKLKLK